MNSSMDSSSSQESNVSVLELSDEPIVHDEVQENSRDTMIKSLFDLFIRHKLTLKALEDTAKLMNSMPGATFNLPTTKYLLIKELLNKTHFKISQHYFCKSCERYSKCNFLDRAKPNACAHCGKSGRCDEFFISIGLEEQIATIIDKHFDEISKFCDSTINNKVNIMDVYNSGHIQKIIERNENVYSVTLNTDGVSIVQSNNSSLWPVLLTCNFLPPTIRFKDDKIILAALYYGRKSPNMHDLLRPLAEEFCTISNGIFVREKFFNIYVTIAVLDLPAKSKVSELMQFNSKTACNFCLQSGEHTAKGIRYTYYDSYQPTLRTHRSMINDINTVNAKPNIVINGIKGVSPMIAFENFDMAKSFCIDYMHAVLLGVVKKTIESWTSTKNHKEPFYLNKQKRLLLDVRLLKIKSPTYINRRPRSLNLLKTFKASEYRSLLLYYLPIVLTNLLPKRYIKHFQSLSSSIYSLLKPTIEYAELDMIHGNLKQFVHDYQLYYGKLSMTMNIHCLLHLVDCVRHYGPLWAYSMFPFESFNGLLKTLIPAPTDVLHQITTRYVCAKINEKSKTIKETADNEFKSEIQFQLDSSHVAAIEAADLSLSNDGTIFFSRFESNGTTFTSKAYTKAKKTVDYYVQTRDETMGAVEIFMICNNQRYAIIEILNVIEEFDQFKKYHSSAEKLVVRAEFIDRYIHIEVLGNKFLVKRPNVYERN